MARIQLRRGNASDWTTANSVLAEGEVGLELDTGKFKWGDGTTAWNDLAYVGGEDASAVAPSLIGLLDCPSVTALDDFGNNSPLNSLNQASLSAQSPPLIVAASSTVCLVSLATPADVPNISDNIDCIATLYVTNADGTETLEVTGNSSQATPISGVGTTIDWTGTSATVVGSDLSWDDTTATVTSAAGGVYFSTLVVSCAPD